MRIIKNILIPTVFGSLMIINGVANAGTAILPGSACVAEGGSADKGIIGSRGEYKWTDTTQSKRIHCPVMSSREASPAQVFNIVNASNGTLTCTVKSLLIGRGGAGLQSGGYTSSSKKVGYGAARLTVTRYTTTQQTVGYISYCDLPAAIGTYRGAASVIYTVRHGY